MDILFLFVVMFLLITLSVPIGFCIGGATILTLYFFTDIPLNVVSQSAVTGMDSFPMLAIPFFVFAGSLMSTGGVAKRIVDVAYKGIGHITGGLATVTILACMFFSAISGSSAATVSAIGGFMIPEMKEKGYDEGFGAVIAATAGTIGIIIPPSIAFVIYGVVTGTSIGDLFIAGIIPGLLMGVALIIASYFVAKKNGYVGGEKAPAADFWKSVWDSKWALLAPVIILGGIYAGIFTPTEAAVVAVVYSFVIGFFVYKELTMEKFRKSLLDTTILVGIAMYLLGLATAFAKYLTLEQVPAKILEWLLGVTDERIILLLLINIFLLLIGTVMDNIPSSIILAPILLPVAVTLGLTPVQFGIMMTMNLTIGLVTPPYGSNLFIASAVANVPMERMLKHIGPLMIALLLVLMIVTYFPQVSTFLLTVLR